MDGITFTITKQPRRGEWQGYADCPVGFCFEDGSHCRSVHYHSGKKADLLAELKAEVALALPLVECTDPECDVCRPVDE